MLKKKMLKAINDQINAEMFSSYLYLSMEAYFQSISLKRFCRLDAGPGAGGADARHEILQICQ